MMDKYVSNMLLEGVKMQCIGKRILDPDDKKE